MTTKVNVMVMEVNRRGKGGRYYQSDVMVSLGVEG